ncbi:general substrate transporter [Plectosphaerella plurivora]|uniref:General substrate transporter n=1 Tax=Plectosphaerella plurivora TaxID=936078 RepID=A0A9P8VB23_9PEZI|nr:general substrate transporter [Plectosphaerella plurivora]
MASPDPSKLEAAKATSGTVAHTEYNGTGAYVPDVELVEAAVAADDEEARLGRKALFAMYGPAVIYSCLLSLALVMEGMDVGLINNFFAHPSYRQKFGWGEDAEGLPFIPANWQTGIGLGNNGGSIIGLLLNGYLQSRFGSRRVYMGAMALMACTIFVLFFATSVEMLLVGNLLCGIPWGIFQTLTTAYAAEICPASIRGYLTAWVSMCWGAGSFLATGVLRGSIGLPGDAGWRVPYGVQWVWVPPLFLVAYFCPESPWYLVRRGKIEEAEHNLRRLARKGHYTEESMRQTIALMKHTNEMEKLEAENASYMDCFRGTNMRRTGIVCMAWTIQILNGQSITNYAATMLRSVGMSATNAFNYNMGIQSVNIFATAIAIALMGTLGRRTFYFYGSTGIGLSMLIVGILGFAGLTKETRAIVVAVFLIIVQCIFKVSLGPTTYVVVGEIASNRVRAQTIVLGRAVYVCGQIVVQVLNPRFLNNTPGSWNLGAKTGIFYFALCCIWAVWIFFFLPETKNRTFADIDYLFKKKTNARKFTTTPIDLFEFNPPQEKLRYDEDDVQAPVQIEEKRA